MKYRRENGRSIVRAAAGLLAAALLIAPAAAAQASQAGAANQTASAQAAHTQRGHITGKVTTKAGRPLAGICIQISGPEFVSAQTGKSGTYRSLPLKPGRYEVHFNAGCGNAGNWAPQYYKNATTEKNEHKVTVTGGHTTRHIGAVMHPGAVVTGTVTNTSGKKLPAICVDLLPAGVAGSPQVTASPPGFIGPSTTRTSKKGFYRAERLLPGRYSVLFFASCGTKSNYTPQQWRDKTLAQQPTIIRLTSGHVVSHINATMKHGAAITGTVTEGTSSGQPLPGICVNLTGQGPLAGLTWSGETRSHGTYSLTKVTPGKYRVHFKPGCGNTENVDPETLPGTVQLTAGQTTTGVNGVLQPSGTMTGR